jgi:hypothetical protein
MDKPMTETATDTFEPDSEATPEPAAAVDVAVAVERPEHVPEKFWDAATGAVRSEALLKSYVELERKLGRMVPLPEETDDGAGLDRLLAVLGRPATAEGYEIAPPHPLVEPDAELNARLHAAGFTQKQAQLVYELAADRLVPMMQGLLDDAEATRQVERLHRRFGGADGWRETSRQLRTWAAASLPADVLDTLSGSYEGVLALHQMMQVAEPDLLGQDEAGPAEPDEGRLHDMMRDPRYWRDRDPDFIGRVTAGFRRLFPD